MKKKNLEIKEKKYGHHTVKTSKKTCINVCTSNHVKPASSKVLDLIVFRRCSGIYQRVKWKLCVCVCVRVNVVRI